MVGDICLAAELGGVPVEVLLRDGTRPKGVPSPELAPPGPEPPVQTGYVRTIRLGAASADLQDVVELVIRIP